ncbi:DUF6734 family protein [Flavitalea flava]
MKIIQTFWSGPPGNTDPSEKKEPPGKKDLRDNNGFPVAGRDNGLMHDNGLSIKAGWLSPEFHWMSWALSCLRLKELYGEVELITDKKGKKVLIDTLGLPYSKVSTSLEGTLDHYPKELWALAKVHSYSIQKEPFIHIDGDVFLWQPFNRDLLHAPVISQNQELNLFFYKTILDEVNANFSYIPEYFSQIHYENKDIRSSNAGIIGGNDLGFIAKYCRNAFDFIDRNMNCLQKVNTGNLNFLFEQYLLYQLAAQQKIPIHYFMEDIVDNPLFRDYVRFEDHPFLKMIHPVGGFKKMHNICNQLAKKLRKDYPDFYYKIIRTLKKAEVPLNIRYYADDRGLVKGMTPGNGVIGFERTIAAIDLLQRKHTGPPVQENPAIKDLQQEELYAFIDSFDIPGLQKSEKDCLLEIFALESARIKSFVKWIADPDTLTHLYNQDVTSFNIIQEVFGRTPEQALTIRVKLNEMVEVMDVNWGWRYEYVEQIPALVSRIFGEPALFRQIALIPSVLQASVDEYNLDEIDMLIAEICKEPQQINEIADKIKPFFGQEEVDKNLSAFFKLITDSVKRMTYAGILGVSP